MWTCIRQKAFLSISTDFRLISVFRPPGWRDPHKPIAVFEKILVLRRGFGETACKTFGSNAPSWFKTALNVIS